mgnify:CR=1 FL=1|jgi:type I restriction enzyme S subunit
MREMKDSGIEWIGKAPAKWNYVRGKYILKYMQKPVKINDGVITCFRNGEVTLRRNRREEGFTMADKEIGYQGVDVGDLVVHGMDGFAGAIGISDSRGKASPVLNVLDSTENKRYVMYYLRSMAYGEVFSALATGIRVRSCDLRWNKLSELIYPVPPLDEQKSIVCFLDNKCSEIDVISAGIQKEIEILEQYKRSVITEAVTKGLNPDVEMKDSGIEWVGNIPAHWDVRPLYYYFAERKKKNYLGQEQNLLSLSYGKVIRKDINTSEGLLPDSFNGYNIIEPGDIVLRLTDLQNDKRSLRTGLVKEHGIITSAYVTLKAAKEVVPEYFHYLLHAYDVMKVLYNMGNGVRQGLNYSELSKMHIVAPPLDEQKNIATRLDCVSKGIESIIASKKQQLAVIDSYKKSLIYEYVTGKKEVV